MSPHRSFVLTIVLALGILANAPVACGQAAQQSLATPRVVVTAHRRLARDDRVRRRLQTQVRVNFAQTPLRVALRALARAARVNLFIYHQSLLAEGIHESLPITLHFPHPVTVAAALKFLCAGISAQVSGYAPLNYTADRGVLVVGSASDMANLLVTRCYRLGPLLRLSPAGQPTPPWRQQARDVAKCLENTVDRNVWVDNGGTVNVLRVMDLTLIITANERDQWRIQRLLMKLAAQVRRQNRRTRKR